VVYELPEPKDAPPDELANQLILPEEGVAEIVTVPASQRLPGTVTVMVGVVFTVIGLLAEAVPHEPASAVKVNVTVDGAFTAGVYVVVSGVLPSLLVNVPPAPPSLHIAMVAPPPKEPPKAAELLP
jgi:hypothetical protein